MKDVYQMVLQSCVTFLILLSLFNLTFYSVKIKLRFLPSRGHWVAVHSQEQAKSPFETLTNIPVLVDLSIKNSQLEIPKDVKTRGDLDLQLKGQWFPYLLSGTYSVKNSKVTLDFTDGSKIESGTKKSFSSSGRKTGCPIHQSKLTSTLI